MLDEADRMIEDGHFKEMKKIIDFIYEHRVQIKKEMLGNQKKSNDIDINENDGLNSFKEAILKGKENILKSN